MWCKTLALTVLTAMVAGSAGAQTFGATHVLWQQRSLYRNVIVLEGNGYRCLTFGRRSARQSCINMAEPNQLVFGYTRRMFEALTLLPSVNRVLVIGIGGGSLPTAIRNKYPDATIDAVELDDAVISVAQQFFNFKPDRKMSAIASDGRIFVRSAIKNGIQYDAVFIDAFDKDYIPEHMASVQFIRQIRQITAPHGLVIANTYTGTKYQYHEEATYQAVFRQLYESKLDNGNRILLTSPDQDTAARVASRWTDAKPLPHSKAQPLTDSFAPANALLFH